MIQVNPIQTRSIGVDIESLSGAAEAPLRVTHLRLQTTPSARVLGVGGESKSSLCLLRGRKAVLTGSLGDLRQPDHYRRYARVAESLQQSLGFKPDVIAHDMHPQYLSTVFARELGLPCIGVQHHHAHAVGVMAEWGYDKRVAAVCCDGLGHGPDGAAWGCEIFSCDYAGFQRRGHLAYFPLVGGDLAAIQTWRPAAALLQSAYGREWRDHLTPSFSKVGVDSLDLFECLERRHLNTPPTSSLGRLIDGVASLLGLCSENAEEADAARSIDAAALSGEVDPYPYATPVTGGSMIIDPAPMIRAIVRDVISGQPVGEIAARFHETIARMLCAVAEMVCDAESLSTVVLAGGCFANQRLRTRMVERLERRHLQVLVPRRVPCGDAGLSFGQAIVAAAIHERVQQCA